MRTTIDIPESLLKQAKARAALDGVRLKDFVAHAIQAALLGHPIVPVVASSKKQVLADDCVFPLLRSSATKTMKRLVANSASDVLDEEDVDHALPRRR